MKKGCTRQQAVNNYNKAHEKHTITSRIIRATSSKPDEMVAEITYRDDGEMGGYNENNMTMTRFKNGAMSLSGESQGFIYLYPEQLQLLRRLLRQRFVGGGE